MLPDGRNVAVCDRVACRLAVRAPRPSLYVDCGNILAAERVAAGRCARWECLAKVGARLSRDDALRVAAHRERLRGELADTPHGDRIAVSLVPLSYAKTEPLRASRRRAFEAHLRAMLAAANVPPEQLSEREAAEEAAHAEEAAPLPAEWQQLLGVACGACRGHCCTQGDTDAFVRADTMRKARARWPTESDDDIVARYLSYLPARAMRPGCVYQGVRGCVLPRDMRGATCNRFLCGGLKELVAQFTAGRTHGVYIGHKLRDAASRRTLRVLPVKHD